MPRRDSYGRLATVIVAIAAVAMAALAVVALANRSSPRVKLTKAQRPLVARLAVLRRAQRGADRSGQFSGPIVPGLTRLVATLPGNWGLGPTRIYLIVRKRDGVAAVTLYRHTIGLEGNGTSVNLHNPHDVSAGLVYMVGIVPDGVASVRWVFKSRYRNPAGRRALLRVSPMVQNNVAVAPIIPHQGRLVAATWFGPDGRVFKP
jgi:hypothetical protein